MFEVTGAPVSPAAAAALIVVRANGRTPQILLLKRSSAARFMPNAYVFPGGAVDGEDASDGVYGLCAGLGDVDASERLGLPAGGLKFFVAAVRESFEECGLLYAYEAAGRMPDLASWPPGRLRELRAALNGGRSGLAALCREHGWRAAVDRLIYFSHWITPAHMKRRFDTRFFIARAPQNQIASLVGEEMSDLIWVEARDALANFAAGRLELMFPTRTLLGQIAAYDDVDALLDFAQRPRQITPIMPTMSDL
jgi:8-oxo-dGTP pyrophosphatase MutT (NUDIX family)